MTKVAEIIRFYSLDEIMEFIENGGEYPLHHLWCYDKIKESGIPVGCIEYDKNSILNKIGAKLQINNLQQQINFLKKSKEFDFIYAPFVADVFLLSILKILGLYKKPILGLALESYVPYKNQFIKRLREKILRKVYEKGIDYILFTDYSLFQISNQYGILGENCDFTNTWGADLDFFQKFIEQQTSPPTLDYIFSTGGTQRDFGTLVNAFNDTDVKLKITTKHETHFNNISPNITIDNSVIPGLYSVGLIRTDYYNSIAVLNPLLKTVHPNTVGITVIMEALAMSKPVISTISKMYPFDLEKEKIGFYVDYNDVEGWRQSVNYLIKNPNEAREMGERGRYLCEKKYNYNLFSEELIKHINKHRFVGKK